MATKPSIFPINEDHFDGQRNITRDLDETSDVLLHEILNASANYTEEVAATAGTGGVTGVVKVDGTKTVYGSIAAALAAAASGDVVLVGPGTYAESSLSVPDGVSLIAPYGALSTFIVGSGATGTRLSLGEGSTIRGFRITLPTDAVPAIEADVDVFGCVLECHLVGAGGSGIGLLKSGTGDILVSETNYIQGDASVGFRCVAGTMNLTNGIICAMAGMVHHGLESLTGGTVNCSNFLIEPTGMNHAIHVEDGNFFGSTIDVRNATVAVHVTDEAAAVSLTNFVAKMITDDVLVIDGGLPSSPKVSIQGEWDREKVTYPATYDNVVLSYTDDKQGDQAFVVDGEVVAGRAERGREAVFGEGDSYTRGMIVLTTDDTATSTTEGGNLTNVSAAAADVGGSSFTFQGVGADHTILIGSDLDGPSDKLKHWGLKILNTTAAVEVTPKSFAIEIWDGAAWTGIGTMATHSSLFYRYGNSLFIRANNSEHVRYGISDDVTWVKKTIDGNELYWSRIRIVTTVTTAPTFDQFKLSTDRTEINGDGTVTHHGNARFRPTLVSSGNIFGDEPGSGVGNANIDVGSGGVPTGWTHNMPNQLLNGSNDAIHYQFLLPKGICTSCPINVNFKYVVANNESPATTVDLICSILPVESVGILVADPTGGVTPVERSVSGIQTLVSQAALTDSVAADTSLANVIYEASFGPFSIVDYYEGDVVFLRIELDDDGAQNSDIAVVAVDVNGVFWTPGGKL